MAAALAIMAHNSHTVVKNLPLTLSFQQLDNTLSQESNAGGSLDHLKLSTHRFLLFRSWASVIA